MGNHKEDSMKEIERNILKIQIKDEVLEELDNIIVEKLKKHIGPAVAESIGSFLEIPVSVKQIPVSEKKQDPDTFFKNKNIFESIEEEDFILWMADLLFDAGMTTEQQGKVIKQLAALMALIDDDTTIEMGRG